MSNVRVRFAPSPTGYLHVGGARTALYNWLYARHHKGQFILRIEDTDLNRSTDESVQGILDGMQFLGLDWDEGPQNGGEFGPYFQTERLSLYQEHAERLVENKRAYECFCTQEELDERRRIQKENKQDIHYDGRCANLTEEEKQQFRTEGRSSVLRFRSDKSGTTEVQDEIRGLVRFDNGQIDDFVIVKSDGMATYNFAVVVDDALMQITHVIRGEDHLSNTPKQIQLYKALDYPVPSFAHIPMILGEDKTRLSKRHGATSVTQFADEGYLPQAMRNYLALLGWSYDDSQTIFSELELVEKFSLNRVSKNAAVFDLQKLQWMNGLYIRELSLDEFYARAIPFWQKAGFISAEPSEGEKQRALSILKELQSRVKLLKEVIDMGYYFFVDELTYNEKAVKKVLYKGKAEDILLNVREIIADAPNLDEETLQPLFAEAQERFEVKLGAIMQPMRVALTGTNVSPGMYEVVSILGREKSLVRIDRALEMIREHKNKAN